MRIDTRKIRTVLDLTGSVVGADKIELQASVMFAKTPLEPDEQPYIVHLPVELWQDLDSPEQITVTVRAGDRLNV